MLYCCGISEVGPVRGHNEDAFLIGKKISVYKDEQTLEPPFIAAVADGVAGEASGEVASRMALELLSAVKPSSKTDYEQKLRTIHRALQKYGVAHRTDNMQTTLCALIVEADGRAVMINVGDSRMYLYRGGIIKQLSRDQSLVQLLYEQGHITPEQRRGHAQKNVIFPVLGNLAEEPSPQISEIPDGLEYGDVIILCSDGLSDNLTAGEMENILAQPKKLPKRLEDLVDRAIQNGSRDNVTVVGAAYLALSQDRIL